MDALGAAGEVHRAAVYAGFRGERADADPGELAAFCDLARRWTSHSIRANRREDGLFHTYNLLELGVPGEVGLTRLDLMLEGQVAILESGLLEVGESLEVLDALRRSELFCPARRSYLLYPDRPRPRFLERNRVPGDLLEEGSLLRELLDAGERSIVREGPGGVVRFAPDLRNAAALERALDRLSTGTWSRRLRDARGEIHAAYEQVFQHRTFTGRSGSFYGYEGLGCIYWHQVSKLRRATLEVTHDALAAGADPELVRRLAARYQDIRAGLGTHDRPSRHRPFPTDPYSHTPGQGGARQPGMTGQAKEDLLCRLRELGACTSGGRLCFDPALLDPADWLAGPATFRYLTQDGSARALELEAGSLAFTICQVPVVLRRAEDAAVTVVSEDGTRRTLPGRCLDSATSAEVFGRTGRVARLEVAWPGPSPDEA